MTRLIEIRTYKLKHGAGGEFHRLVQEESAPLHAEWGMDVVTFQAALYGSAAWRNGPRESIVSLILSDANAVMWLDRNAVEQLRNARGITR